MCTFCVLEDMRRKKRHFFNVFPNWDSLKWDSVNYIEHEFYYWTNFYLISRAFMFSKQAMTNWWRRILKDVLYTGIFHGKSNISTILKGMEHRLTDRARETNALYSHACHMRWHLRAHLDSLGDHGADEVHEAQVFVAVSDQGSSG